MFSAGLMVPMPGGEVCESQVKRPKTSLHTGTALTENTTSQFNQKKKLAVFIPLGIIVNDIFRDPYRYHTIATRVEHLGSNICCGTKV